MSSIFGSISGSNSVSQVFVGLEGADPLVLSAAPLILPLRCDGTLSRGQEGGDCHDV